MSLDKIKKGRAKTPVVLCLYGTHGIGKSTFISQAPNAIILDVEGSCRQLNCERFEKEDLSSYTDVKNELTSLLDEDHSYKFVGIDTLDWLEQLIHDHTIRSIADDKGRFPRTIEGYGFGKGYVHALKYWQELFQMLEDLRTKKNMNVIMSAHAAIKRYDSPESEAYDRYQPDLAKPALGLLCQWVDGLFFANYKTFVKKSGDEKREHIVGVSSGERVMYTEERPAFLAKNRWSFPAELPFGSTDNPIGFQSFAEHYAAWLASETPNSK